MQHKLFAQISSHLSIREENLHASEEKYKGKHHFLASLNIQSHQIREWQQHEHDICQSVWYRNAEEPFSLVQVAGSFDPMVPYRIYRIALDEASDDLIMLLKHDINERTWTDD